MRWPTRWPPLVVATCLAQGVVVATGARGALALAVTVWLLLAGAGMAFVPLLSPLPAAGLALGLAVSVAVDTAVATVMVLAGMFAPAAGLVALIGICLIGCGLQIRRWPPGWSSVEIRLHA